MIKNHIELVRDQHPQALLTWHLPDDNGHFYPIAFQFAEGLDDASKREITEIATRPLKSAEKDHKLVQPGSSDHFAALPRPLGRLGFRVRIFGVDQAHHVLADRPLEQP